MESKKKDVQGVILNTLKVNAPVVLLENEFEDHELEKVGDFTELPNRELQPKNLYDACINVLRNNITIWQPFGENFFTRCLTLETCTFGPRNIHY